jgi:hypothetical protein
MSDKPRTFKQWLTLMWDLLWDWKQLKPHLTSELHHVAKFPLVLFCAILFSVLGCYFVTSHFAGKKLESTRSAFQSTNSFLAGQLNTTTTELKNLKSEYSQKIIEHANATADLKTDYNEKLRNKDTEILKLTSERDNALQRTAVIESMPGNLFNIYTNIAANAPTNLNQFAFILNDFSNSVAQATIMPEFSLSLNKTPILGNGVLILTNRSVSVEIQNVGDLTAENATIVFTAQLSKTNLLKSHDWDENSFSSKGSDLNVWATINGKNLAPGSFFDAETFVISTNFTQPFLAGRFSVYSSKSKKKDYVILLVFAPPGIPPIFQKQ